MKLKLINLSKTEIGNVELPSQFNESVRPDLIKKAVLAIQSHKRQPYGAYPEAGKRSSSFLSKRRRKYRGTYGIGQSRTPRKVLNRSGTRFYYVGAFVPQTVGGRRAHPPKATKNWELKINLQERRKAIRSAMSATIDIDWVKQRGHTVPKEYPFAIEESIEDLKTAKAVKNILEKLGFKDELIRCEDVKTRAGRGKSRGRKKITRTGLLIVVSAKCDLMKATKNLPGLDVLKVTDLNAEDLAPGCVPGRLTLYTKKALSMMKENALFLKNPVKNKTSPKQKTEKKEVPKKASLKASASPAKTEKKVDNK